MNHTKLIGVFLGKIRAKVRAKSVESIAKTSQDLTLTPEVELSKDTKLVDDLFDAKNTGWIYDSKNKTFYGNYKLSDDLLNQIETKYHFWKDKMMAGQVPSYLIPKCNYFLNLSEKTHGGLL